MSRARRAGTRRRRYLHVVLATSALAVAAIAPATATATASSPAYGTPQYWAFADRMQQRLDPLWDAEAGYYRAGPGGVEPMTNALLLLTHSVAALEGHEGPARNDRRARLVARRLVSEVPFVTRPPHAGSADSQVHAPGWVSSMTSTEAPQHLVFDAEVIDGLAFAYRARRQLGLPAETAARIRTAVHETARSAFWRWPALRLNQINWYALVYAADATVTGDPKLLRRDLSLQLRRFFRGADPSGARAGNFGLGMRFHYLPYSSPARARNLDSAEYANVVLSFTRFYGQARRAGMPSLEPHARRLMREWTRRAISGYWTHGGYMNWDTGLGFKRWHQAKKLGLTQQALIGMASTPSLLPGPRWAAWSKHLLDRSLAYYDRAAERNGGMAEPVFFGLTKEPQTIGSARLAAARVQANAARAIDAGLGRAPAARPPALYAFDPDIGRLAVTTPAYNTAVVPVNQRAFPYGGLDIARLFDGDQDVAGNIGGKPQAAFGMIVRSDGGHQLLATQSAQPSRGAGGRPLRLTRAPSGAGAIRARRAYAGPFTDLSATGTIRAHGLAATVAHRFTPAAIRTSWALRRPAGSRDLHVEVRFPSWGGERASIVAIGTDGRRGSVGGPLRVRDVDHFEVHSAEGGYRIEGIAAPSGAIAEIVRPAPEDSNPLPGPSLVIRLARGGQFHSARLTATIAPADR